MYVMVCDKIISRTKVKLIEYYIAIYSEKPKLTNSASKSIFKPFGSNFLIHIPITHPYVTRYHI